MPVYVIADREKSELSSPIFAAGVRDSEESEESAAVFTTRMAAEKYIEEAQWSDTDTVAELESEALLHWVINLRADEVEYLAVNPCRGDHESGLKQPVISIRELTQELTSAIVQRLHSPAPAPIDELEAVAIYCCQSCGRVERQSPEASPPKCCDREMEFSANDSVRVPLGRDG